MCYYVYIKSGAHVMHMKTTLAARIAAIWANNYVRVRAFGNAPPYRGRVLVIALWWHDDAYWYWYITLRGA
jgi:translation elongation factor EF-Tu-like GTPase